jgi:hypothetical protein
MRAVLVEGGRMNRDKGEGIWLMGFIPMYEIDETSYNCFKRGKEGVVGGVRWWERSNQCLI